MRNSSTNSRWARPAGRGGRGAAAGPWATTPKRSGGQPPGPSDEERAVTVYLVGAGPGDPGLFTRRGAELLARADVVVHDRLGTAALLPLAAPNARLIDVGKAPGRVAMTQDDINATLV